MKKVSEIILLVMLIISFCVLIPFGCYKAIEDIIQEKYNETPTISDEIPTISEIKERSKQYMLDVWAKSGIELEFITQELINKNTLVYYFKVVRPDYIYVNGRINYIKTVYYLQDTGMSSHKTWEFDRVITSNYSEVKALLEVEDER